MKKLVALILAMLCALTCVACGGGGSTGGGSTNGGGAKYNVEGSGKTVIKFRNPGGGYGREWIDAAAEDFAKLHAETSFAEGQKGVYIDVLNDMNFDVNSLDSSTVDCLLGDGSAVTRLAPKLYDLTEVVTCVWRSV